MFDISQRIRLRETVTYGARVLRSGSVGTVQRLASNSTLVVEFDGSSELFEVPAHSATALRAATTPSSVIAEHRYRDPRISLRHRG